MELTEDVGERIVPSSYVVENERKKTIKSNPGHSIKLPNPGLIVTCGHDLTGTLSLPSP